MIDNMLTREDLMRRRQQETERENRKRITGDPKRIFCCPYLNGAKITVAECLRRQKRKMRKIVSGRHLTLLGDKPVDKFCRSGKCSFGGRHRHR
jgi:hypothetical protein